MLPPRRITRSVTFNRPAWLVIAALAACYATDAHPAFETRTAVVTGARPQPANYTYLIAVRIRRRFGFTLGCHDSLHTRTGYEFVALETSVCSLLRRATANAAGHDAASQPWLAVHSCRADRFLCDQGLPLAQVALTLKATGGSGGQSTSVGMTDLRVRFRSAAHADEREMLVDQLQVMDYNECGSDDLNDCSLNAVCQNRPGTYACRCRDGFADLSPSDGPSGKVCAPLCGQAYCANGGECSAAGVCHCSVGYRGSTCEMSADDDADALGGESSRGTLAMVIGSLALTLAAAVFLVLWYRSRSAGRWRNSFHALRHGSDGCGADVCTGVLPAAVAAPQHYHRLLAAKGSVA